MKRTEKRTGSVIVHIFRKLTAAVMTVCLLVSCSLHLNLESMVKAKAAAVTYGTMTVYKWDKLSSLHGDHNSFYGLLVYSGSDGAARMSMGDSGRDSTHWWCRVMSGYNPYMSEAKTFYTKSKTECPYFSWQGTDGDNADANKYKIYMQNSSGGWTQLNYHGNDIYRGKYNDVATIIDSGELKKKGVSANSGEYMVFYNISVVRDTFVFGRDGEFYGDSSGGGWPGTKFRMYRRSETEYSCLNYNYTVDRDQVMIVDSNVIVTEKATLTVPEGAVLVVKKGNLFVNGTIVLDGGTMLVEDGGRVMPFESDGNGCRIVVKDKGSLIVRSGGRVYAGCPKGDLLTKGDQGWLDAHPGATIINYGLLAAGQYNFYPNSIIETHENASTYLGARITVLGAFTDNAYSKKDAGSVGLKLEPLGSILKGTVKVYEGGCLQYKGSQVNAPYHYYYKNGKEETKTLK